MALTRPFPIDQAYPNASDIRKQNSAVFPREGIFPDPITTNLAAAAAGVAGVAYPNGGWNVGANPFVANAKRGGAPYTQAYGSAQISDDAAGTAWTITPAPGSGTRVDRLWFKPLDPGQGDATSGTDGPGGVPRAVPIFGKTDGAPGLQALPAGCVEVAQVSTPSTASSIAQSTITQTYAFANVLGAPLVYRDRATLVAATTGAMDGDRALCLADRILYRFVVGVGWKEWDSPEFTFTPVWAGTTEGNSVTTCTWRYSSGYVEVELRRTTGTTGSITAGHTFSLPVALHARVGVAEEIGVAGSVLIGGTPYKLSAYQISAGTARLAAVASNGAYASLAPVASGSVPATVATGAEQYFVHLKYPPA